MQHSSLLDQQEVHRHIRNHNERAPKDGQADDIVPQRKIVEAKRTQNTRARDFNVQPVAMVFEAQLGDLVDDEAFVAVVKDR
jgi:hypothetical protein